MLQISQCYIIHIKNIIKCYMRIKENRKIEKLEEFFVSSMYMYFIT